MGFEQATIPIERRDEFAELRGAIERVFAPQRVEKFLAALKSKGVRIRDFESALKKKVVERVEPGMHEAGRTAEKLYQSLTVSDQGQMREFYLSQVEQVPPELRHRYHQLYRDS